MVEVLGKLFCGKLACDYSQLPLTKYLEVRT